jgi:hypothetical protein
MRRDTILKFHQLSRHDIWNHVDSKAGYLPQFDEAPSISHRNPNKTRGETAEPDLHPFIVTRKPASTHQPVNHICPRAMNDQGK